MKVMADTSLKQIRERFNLSQEGIARRTNSVSTGTVRNAENGRKVSYGNATQILEAVNTVLAEHGEQPITLEELGLKLF